MKLKLPWRKSSIKSGFSSLESLLSSALKPIKPNPDFVQNLRIQLTGDSAKKVFGLPAKAVKTGLIALGAGASIFLILLAGIRVVISILTALGILHQANKQMKEKQIISPPAAV